MFLGPFPLAFIVFQNKRSLTSNLVMLTFVALFDNIFWNVFFSNQLASNHVFWAYGTLGKKDCLMVVVDFLVYFSDIEFFLFAKTTVDFIKFLSTCYFHIVVAVLQGMRSSVLPR